MNSWRPYPLLRLLFPFLIGIITGILSGSFGGRQCWVWAFMACLLAFVQIFSGIFSNYRLRWVSGLMINIFFLLAGYEITGFHRTSNDPDYLGLQPDGLFIATIAEPPSIKKSSFKAILNIRYRRDKNRWVRTCGQAVGYLKHSANNWQLQYGDFILLHAGFLKIQDNSNPHTFDYFKYLNNKNINHQVFADPMAWKSLKIKSTGIIQKFAFQLRDSLLNILRRNQVTGREFAVASALLLGYVDELDADLKKDYAATGAMHILSVSGMHVGIIYIFLEFLLRFMNKRKALRLLKAIILLIFIWFYALLTGLSPCVFRSAAMLSLPIVGKSLHRSPDMFNIISASFLLILAVDPFLILDVGFQLSYLAVLGIVILYRPIYNLFISSAWFPDKIWSIVAISIAAQIATLPIALYAFHQFPNYFMVTNIFVVPLSSLIIYIGILLMVVGAIPLFSILCAKVLIALVWLLNSIIHFIEQLPFSTVKGIHISEFEMVLLYLIIGLGFLYLMQKQVSYLYLFLIACIVLNLFILDFKVQRLKSSRLIIYNSNRSAIYQFSSQDKAVCIYNGIESHELSAEQLNSNMVGADMYAHGIKYLRSFWSGRADYPVDISKDFLPVFYFGNFIQFSNKKIAIIRKSIPEGLKHNINVDFLVFSGNPKIRVIDAVNIFHPRQIIIDATNSRFRTMQWLREAATQRVACQAVTQHGAFEKEF
ncbi:MAG: ComEC/Rec2 family competence protein [Bacteroidota bacterium]